jgi:hypothetical protein
MQTQRVDWPALVACLLTRDDGRERYRAQWLACCEVVDNPDWYRPLPCDAFPALLQTPSGHMLTPKDIEDRGRDLKGEGATPLGTVFGWWRAHVTDVEALNAGRLQTLAVTLQTLADLHRKSTDPNAVSLRIEELGAFVENVWRTLVPMSGDVRAWSVRITRRFDLLPADWREL